MYGLLSEFDLFLTDHVKKYRNPKKGNTSYLSANICNEFIGIMEKQVLMKIVGELKAAKYFSISIDSTPDLSHVDQLTFVVRYIKDGVPIERFLQFIPIKEHKAEYLTETVLKFLENYNISSTRVYKQESKKDANLLFSMCGTFSQLGGPSYCVLEITSFFQLVQKLQFLQFFFKFYPSVENTDRMPGFK